MPVTRWNGKPATVLATAAPHGFISYNGLQGAIGRGYASGSTDTGHQGSQLDGSWMLNNPILVEDFAQRSQHLTAVAAKAIVKAYYSKAPEHSYLHLDARNGGGQGMQEAQRFPDDYDGIVNGDGARDLTHEWAGELYPAWVAQTDQQGLAEQVACAPCCRT